MQLTNNLGYLLQHLAFTLGRQSDQVLQERLGIGFSQFKILMVLKWNPKVQQKHIADSLGQTEASISRQIKLLYDQGLLSSRKNPDNKREHIADLTTRGLRVIDEALQVLNDYHAPVFGKLSAREQEALKVLLQKMHEEACAPGRAANCQHPFNT
jgi:MarR family transcriptional regulator for hemolysin